MIGSKRVGIWPLLGVFVLVASLYSIVVPPFETPDEIWHYAFIHHLASGEGLPISEANTQAMWRQQGVQAPGYYLLVAGLTAWVDQSNFPQLYARANPHRAIGQRAVRFREPALARRKGRDHDPRGSPMRGREGPAVRHPRCCRIFLLRASRPQDAVVGSEIRQHEQRPWPWPRQNQRRRHS